MPSEEGRERERDSKALSRVCAPARGARSPRGAREGGGGARPRGARPRASLPRARARASPGALRPALAPVRCARRPARGSTSAALPLCLPGVLPPEGAGGCVREEEGSGGVRKEGGPAGGRERDGREGDSAVLQPGPR